MRIVRFTPAFFASIRARAAWRPASVTELDRMQAQGFEVQGEPRPGRINVRQVRPDGSFIFRTYAARDLVPA